MDFVKVASYRSRLEAETIGHALDQYNIPHLVKNEDAGGMLVDLMPGASLWVPVDKVSIVAKLLNCAVKPPSGKRLDPDGGKDDSGSG